MESRTSQAGCSHRNPHHLHPNLVHDQFTPIAMTPGQSVPRAHHGIKTLLNAMCLGAVPSRLHPREVAISMDPVCSSQSPDPERGQGQRRGVTLVSAGTVVTPNQAGGGLGAGPVPMMEAEGLGLTAATTERLCGIGHRLP